MIAGPKPDKICFKKVWETEENKSRQVPVPKGHGPGRRTNLDPLPGLPCLDPLRQNVLDGPHNANIVVDHLRQQEKIILKKNFV